MDPDQQAAYNVALKNWHEANDALVRDTSQPALRDRLEGIVPDTADALNRQAGERTVITTRLVEYKRAFTDYYKALGEPLTKDQHDQFLVEMPLDSDEMATTLGYMHNVTPEVERYRHAMQANGMDPQDISESLSHIPRDIRNSEFRDIVESAAFYDIHGDNAVEDIKYDCGVEERAQAVNDALSVAPVTPGSVAAQACQMEQGMGVDQYPPQTLHGQDEPGPNEVSNQQASAFFDGYDFSDPNAMAAGDPSMIAGLQSQGVNVNAGMSASMSSSPDVSTSAPAAPAAPSIA